jgi:hypothetical protein
LTARKIVLFLLRRIWLLLRWAWLLLRWIRISLRWIWKPFAALHPPAGFVAACVMPQSVSRRADSIQTL